MQQKRKASCRNSRLDLAAMPDYHPGMDTKIFPIKPGIRLAETPTIQRMVEQKGGKAGIEQTLGYMKALKDDYKTNPIVRGLAMSLIAQLPQKDYQKEILILTEYVKNQVRYTRDIAGVETLQTPLKTLEFGQGDCDDKSMLLAAMLESVGHHTRFKAVGMKKNDFCHVFPEVNYKGKWIALETTEPVAAGWEPPGIVETMTVGGIDGFFSDSKDKILSKVKGDLTEPWNIKKKLERDMNQPGIDKIMKIKGLGVILNIVGIIFPVVAVAMTYINYAINLMKAAKALQASTNARKSSKNLTNRDKLEIIQDEKRAAKMIEEANNAAIIGNKIYDLDKLSNLLLYSSAIAIGSGAYYLHKRGRL